MSTSNRNRASMQAQGTRVSEALATHFNGAASFTFGGTAYKVKELQQKLQSRTDAAHATDAARAKWLTAAAAEREVTQEIEGILLALKNHLVTTYGAKSQIVADFGFTPKVRKVSAEATAAAVAKRRATRAAKSAKGETPVASEAAAKVGA